MPHSGHRGTQGNSLGLAVCFEGLYETDPPGEKLLDPGLYVLDEAREAVTRSRVGMVAGSRNIGARLSHC